MGQKDDDRAWVRQLGLFGQIVSELVVSIGVGGGLGYLARRTWSLGTWAVVLGILAGFLLAIFRIYALTRKETS